MPRRVPGVLAWRDGWLARHQMDGKRSTQFFASYDEAVAWRAKQVEAAVRGRRSAVAGRRTTFAEHWESWRASVVRRDNTLAQYDSTYRTYLDAPGAGSRWGGLPVRRLRRG
jgi:hypothetical protein